MIRCKTRAFLIYLLVIFVFSPVSCQDEKAEITDDDTIDLTQTQTQSTESASDKTEDDRGAGQMVGQSLVPPLLGQGLMPGPLSFFSAVFPALNSLMLWSNMFPVSTLLGQPPPLLGAPQQGGAFQGDLSPSASKVVLVLAEDRNPHAAMKAANQEAARTIRQNDIISQMLAQLSQADLGQLLSQSLEPMQQQNAGQMLAQMVPPELSQSMNQLLSQMLQPLPGLDLSQLPLLGQALGQPAPSAEPTVGAAAEAAAGDGDAAAATADVTPSSSQTFPFPNFQSAIDAGTQMLGQAFQQPSGDSNSPFQLPNIQQALDAGSQMLGQALQQANVDQSSSAFPLPNIQSVLDSGAQMLSQSGGLFNLRPTQSLDPAPSASDAEPAASEMSEVRVKPDVIPTTVQYHSQYQMPPTVQNPSQYQMPTTDNIDQLKMMSSLHKAFVQKKLPILWFRGPTDPNGSVHEFDIKHNTDTKPKSLEELQMETKLQAFQRQVIRELRLLQDIERQAKEMRAASKGVAAKTYKDPSSKFGNTLSKIPVHKITRGDIEKALNDEYVRKLLQKTAFGNMKEASKMAFQQMHMPDSGHMKRETMQTSATMIPRQMSREDIIRLLAYAYRMANLNGIRMFDSSGAMKSTKENDGKARGSVKDNTKPMERQMMKTGRKWTNDGTQMTQTQTTGQNPPMPTDSRQMLDKMRATMERQWASDTNAPKSTTSMSRQSGDQQMPMPNEQNCKQNPSMMPQSRQMIDKMQANPQMPMQQPTQKQQQQFNTQSELESMPRQNMATPSAMTTAEGRKWAEEQSQNAMQQAQMMMQQQPENAMQQLPQMARQQQPVTMQQQSQMDMQKPQVTKTNSQMEMQQPRVQEMQQMSPDMQKVMHGPLLVGAATPQMPETTGKARHKDDDWGGWGGGWGGWGDGWGGGWGDGWGGGWGGWGGGWGDGWGGWGGWGGGKKGGKHGHGGWPTVVNYYYNPGRAYHRDGVYDNRYIGSAAPAYQSGANYGTTNYAASTASQSSGYTAPSSSAYRTAVGDDEIQAMLEEHSRQKMMTETDHKPTTTVAFVPLTTTHQATTTKSTTIIKEDNRDQKNIELEKEPENSMDSDNENSITTTPTKAKINNASSSKCVSELPRLDYKLRLNGILDLGKGVKGKWVRQKRNADYGTLQPIDPTSLDELRIKYKDSLREITLQPDEDPTEALMRYNAASIREALEQANHEPLEVNAAELPTNEGHYGHDAQMTILESKPIASQPIVKLTHYHNHPQQHSHDQANKKLQQTKQGDHIMVMDRQETISTAINESQSSKASVSDETQTMISSLPESELQTVLELIKQEMQKCCDSCRDRILSNIKFNIKNANSRDSTTKLTPEKTEPIDDEQYKKWLREMEIKGYDSKYLTKSHYWEYLNSGKLTLALESNEDAATQGQNDNKIAKRSNGQTFKRYAQTNSLSNDKAEPKNQSKKVDILNRANGIAFAKKTPEFNYAIKENAHVVNDELRHLKEYTEDENVTSSPYAMRGKFKRSKNSQTDSTPITTTPVKFNAMTQQSTSDNNNKVDTKSGKVVELLSLLYDLGPKVHTENGKPTQLSVMVMPIVRTSTARPVHALISNNTISSSNSTATTSRTRTKRMRSKRKNKADNNMTATSAEHAIF